jgi:hypothetical protein
MSPFLGEERNIAKDAYNLITHFNEWQSGRVNVSNPEAFEGEFKFSIPTRTWLQLREDLKLAESNKK